MDFTKSQLEAIEHNGSDLIISAAAGSGKTATLTERIIRKIKSGADISRMLIVTFTKAAASELKNKICKLIGAELRLNPSDVHLSSQLVKASYADICTIDSFCMKLVRPNFDRLMIDSNFRVGETGELKILEEQTMEELIDELYEEQEQNEDFLLVASCYTSIWSESELARALLSLRNKLLSTSNGLESLLKIEGYDDSFLSTPYGSVLTKHIKEATEHFIPIYRDTLSALEGSAVGKEFYIPAIGKELEYIERVDRSIARKDGYDELRKIVLDYTFEKLPQKAFKDGVSISYFRSERIRAKKTFETIMERYFASDEKSVISSMKQNAVICRAIYNILSAFEQKLQRKKRLLSVYSFNDISTFALSLLYDKNDNPTAFARDVASKYDEVYIDEYQDTNSIQDKIFKAISNNNRFMVGDIKQSIYRFRSAEPEIFSYYRTHFSTGSDFDENSLGRSIFMSNNFRCDEPIIDFSNLVSDYMFKNSHGIPYGDEDRLVFSKSIEGEYTNKKAEIHLINNQGLGKGHDSTAFQAEYVAKMIKELIDNGTLPNGDKVKPSDIAILLRNSEKQIPIYVEALQRQGIFSIYRTNEAFFDKAHIMLVLCILNAIDNPSRDIYLAGAMRSEIFGFSLADLVKIKKRMKGTASLYSTIKSYNKDDELKEKISQFLLRLSLFKTSIKRLTSHEAISYIYNQCGFLTMCTAQQRADFMKLYNIAREFEGGSFKGLFSFLRHIDSISQEYDSRDFKGDVTKESVKLISIHASKGLEYGICFICGIENTFNYGDVTDPLLFQRELGIAGMVGKRDGLASFEPLIRKCIAIQKTREMHEEEMRILYVAMTRAKHQLILTGSVSNPEALRESYIASKNYVSPYELYSSSSYLKFVLGGIATEHPCYSVFYDGLSEGDNEECATIENEISRDEVEAYKEIFDKRFNFTYQYGHLESIPSKMSVSRLYPEVLDEQNKEIEIPELASVPKFLSNEKEKIAGTQRGIATHVFMQFCDFERLVSLGFDAELERLIELKFISESDARLVNKRHIEMFAKSSLLSEILKAKRVYREFRFNVMLDASEFTKNELLFDERVLVQGVTDCIYESCDGELVLVDYKTDFVTPESYERVLTERYERQLLYYKRACELMFEMPVSRTLLYSVPLARVVEIKAK